MKYLSSDEEQEIAAQNFYRPRNQEILAKYSETFKPVTLFTIDEAFGGWIKAHDEHFADGGTFDQIYQKRVERSCNTRTPGIILTFVNLFLFIPLAVFVLFASTLKFTTRKKNSSVDGFKMASTFWKWATRLLKI